MLLIPPTDPQIPGLLAEVNAAKANTFPSGMPANSNLCFDLYEKKITSDKDYYDPRFVGWYAFTCSAKADDRPRVVDANNIDIIDPSVVYRGLMVSINAAISGYSKGTGGVGGWLNGLKSTGQEGQFGRLDGRPTVEMMFGDVSVAADPAAVLVPPPAAPATPATPAAPAAPAAPAGLIMTEKAAGVTYEQYKATPGWTDELLIEQGLAIRPSFG